MERSYLIRYGLMGRVGRFNADPGASYGRGEAVVVRSHRGTELGEVLLEAPSGPADDAPARVVRPASPDDLERGRGADADRGRRFDACARVFRDGLWPIELVDVEPLLDDRRTVLHYLGPHRLDVAGLLAAFRDACDLDVMLEPVGRDAPDGDEPEPPDEPAHACGSAGGGCGSGGCGSGSSGGCADCGVKKLLADRR